MMIAQMIASEMLETLQWGFGGALAVVLLTVTFAALGVFVRLFGVARLMGGAR
jgi:ABC-type spermidine/putrescine transport system permease subunit I